MLGLSALCHMIALPFVDLVVLATNAPLGIVMNNILSVKYLQEKMVKVYDYTATVLLILGSLLIIFLSSYEEATYTTEDVKALLWSPTMLIFACCYGGFIAGTVLQLRWHSRKLNEFNQCVNTWLDSKLNSMQEPLTSRK